MVFNRFFCSVAIMGVLVMLPPAKKAVAEEPTLQPQLAGGMKAGPQDPIRDIITKQLEAIQKRNAATAYALTTADFHEKFASPEVFMGHMRFEYRPIYNHEAFVFLDRQAVPGGALQKVEVRDSYGGEPMTVLYRLEAQPDGGWLIDSFMVLDSEAQPI